MKGDIGMANYEKQVEQEAAYPIPISLLQDSEAKEERHSYLYTLDSISHASLSCNSCTKI